MIILPSLRKGICFFLFDNILSKIRRVLRENHCDL